METVPVFYYAFRTWGASLPWGALSHPTGLLAVEVGVPCSVPSMVLVQVGWACVRVPRVLRNLKPSRLG